MNNKKDLHPAVFDLESDLRHGRLSRREFLRLATLLGTSAITAYTLAGCNFPASSDTPTSEPIKRGGTMRIGSFVQEISHPAQLTWAESANQLRQVAEYLTETGADNLTRPWLLADWETDTDVKTWTLYLRSEIKFNDGSPLTADDVIFNFEQWLNPDLNSSMASLLAYLSQNNIEKVDDLTIRLHLNDPQISVPEHLFHYPALIVPRHFEGDFTKQPLGTGPFTMTEYTPGVQAILKRRTDYWRSGADGSPLPYLDELIYLDLEPQERIAAIQGGLIDTLFNPTSEEWATLKDTPGIRVHGASTAGTYTLRMRVDQPPWDDVRVRQALMLCQDRQVILDAAEAGQGDLGIDAHIAPIHPAYCPKPIPDYNPEKASALLTEAGYPNGLQIQLTTKNNQAEPDIARVLKSLAQPGGFEIELNIVEPAKYWSQWTEVDLGITTWAHRPLSTMSLALAYTADEEGKPVAWNETHWIDPEFISLLRQAEQTIDIAARREIMCQLEDIMQTRGPVGISYWRKQWKIIRTEFKNVKPHPSEYDLFYDVWKDA